MDWSRMFASRVVVFGCGNILFGDDALGPRVVETLNKDPDLPSDVAALDAGTSIRALLFDLLLSEKQPELLIIVDATSKIDRKPGEVFEIDVDQVDTKRIGDFSMHQFPTSNLLKELKETSRSEVRIIAIQAAYIPEQMDESLSPEAEAAIPVVVDKIKELAR
ncbi:MAG: hydrogenase maturation protease [Desulfonatronovibrionaceae bacterium]